MKYRVILLKNGEYKKTLYKSMKIESSFIFFHELIEENNKILFPKVFINSNGIKPVKYQICVTKTTEKDDVFRVLRDGYGKLYTEKPLGDWTILSASKYQIEETFWIYGLDNTTERSTISEIVKRLMIGVHGKKMVKEIIVVYNKLIIYNENQFDMVICKNLEDAQRLHHTLSKICKKQKIKNLLFMGTATKATRTRMYDIIHEETGWPYIKIRKTSTRP